MENVCLQDNLFNVSIFCDARKNVADVPNLLQIEMQKNLFQWIMKKKFLKKDYFCEMEKFNQVETKLSDFCIVSDKVLYFQRHRDYSIKICKWRSSNLKNCRVVIRLGKCLLLKLFF